METVIDLDIPSHESVLVLNGLLDTDTNARVVISHSVGAFSNAVPAFINNANVLLYQDNQFIDSLLLDTTSLVYVHYTDAIISDSLPMYYYKSNYIPDNNSTYRVEVNHSDYNSISAETYIPNDIDVNIINIDTITNENKIGLEFDFQDNIDQENFYRLKLYTNCEKKEGYRFRGQGIMLANDPSFGESDIFEGLFQGYSFVGHEVVFNDNLFNGQQKKIILDAKIGKPGDDFEFYQCDTIIIEFSTFSDDTYSYYNSLGDHSEKGELGLFGGEVIPVYTNVENGLGILISTNAQQIYLKP
jgi:hypothetical protein